MNTLYYGDNLDILRRYIAVESVDLIYLDPPFNSDADYNILFKERGGERAAAQIKAFEDTWTWTIETAAVYREVVEDGGPVSSTLESFFGMLGTSDMMAYLVMMAPRLVGLHRVLKSSGSLYLHCDPLASHYLKVLLDAVFGARNFRSEIVWRRTNSHNKTTRQYGPIHDTILFYSKSNTFVFHPGVRPYTKAYIDDRFKFIDARGRYQTNYLTGPEVRHGESGRPWRGFDPTLAGRHWAVPQSVRQFLPNDGGGMSSHEQLEHLFQAGIIVFPKKAGGQPMYKQYVGPGVLYQDIWAYQPNTRGVLWNTDECIDQDVKYLEDEPERLEYPTQKPVGLLDRILTTSSDNDSVILDPFCGCGTTISSAEKLKRPWIGIDITHLSIGLIKHRLHEEYGPQISKTYRVIGEPVSLPDAEKLASEDQFQFQAWALGLVGARTEQSNKKGADKGVDGLIIFYDDTGPKSKKVVLSVKAGKNIGVAMVRDLVGTVQRDKAQIGVLITMTEPTAPMLREAASAGFYDSPMGGSYPRIQILTIAELLADKGISYPTEAQRSNVTFKKARRIVAEVQTLPFSALISPDGHDSD